MSIGQGWKYQIKAKNICILHTVRVITIVAIILSCTNQIPINLQPLAKVVIIKEIRQLIFELLKMHTNLTPFESFYELTFFNMYHHGPGSFCTGVQPN